MDQKYVDCTDSYEDSMSYIDNPFEKFTAHTEKLAKDLCTHLEENYLSEYKNVLI